MILIAVIAALLMLIEIGQRGYRAYRFDRYAITADAQIIDSDLGCIFATGSPGGSGTISYRIVFGTADGPHRTEVLRPCDVIPPDFGRGRGAIWIEYDPADPDRVRVLTDRSDRDAVIVLSVVLGLYPVIIAAVLLTRRYLSPCADSGDRSERPASP